MNSALQHLRVVDYADLIHDKYYIQGTFHRTLMATIHDHDFYEINYVLEGGCKHLINNIPLDMTEGDATILRPGDTHGFLSQLPHTNLLSLSICIEEMERFLHAYGDSVTSQICARSQPPIFHLTAHQQNDYRTDFEQILILNQNQRRTRVKIMLDKMLQFYMLYLERPLASNNANAHLLDALAQFNMPEHIREGVPALLRLTNFSHAQLCRVMKSSLGVTPQQYVVSLRLNLALELLQVSDLSLESIISQVGYSSLSHFNMIFTQRFGLTPSEARRKIRVKTI